MIARMEKEIAGAARAAEIARRETAEKTPPRRWPIPPESRRRSLSLRLKAVCSCRSPEHECVSSAHPTASGALSEAY